MIPETKRRLGVAAVVVGVVLMFVGLTMLSGCTSYMTPKHKELVDLNYENIVEYVGRLEGVATTDDPEAPVPADVVEFLRADVEAWEAMHAIAHFQKVEGGE